MKKRKFLILLPMVFAMVALFVSCGYRKPGVTWPSTQAPSIATTSIEVTGDPAKNEILRIEFDRNTGKCKNLVFINNEKEKVTKRCELSDELSDFVFDLQETYYCTPPDNQHPSNTDIDNDGTKDRYCGRVLFLTEGANIQFKADSAAGNRVCSTSGGITICYPPPQ